MFRDGLTQMELAPPEAQRLACDSAGLLSTTIPNRKHSVYRWGGGFRGAQSRRRKSRLSG